MSNDADKQTVALNLSDPAAHFALSHLLSSTVNIVDLDSFDVVSRKFRTREVPVDLIITDLRKCALEQIRFEVSYLHRTGPKCVALVPTCIAATYFFRLQRAKIPICLTRNGLQPVQQVVQQLLAGDSQNLEETLFAEDICYLRYGTRNLALANSFPEQFRYYLPRLSFDDAVMQAELDIASVDLSSRLENLCSSLGVFKIKEAIDVAALHGIGQLLLEEDVLENKIFEANTMSAIANWLTAKTKKL